jgi:hypothetical protein
MKVLLALLLCVFALNADSLKLRDGRTYDGQFLGATRSEIWFQRDGEHDFMGTLVVPVGQVEALTFSPSSESARVKPPASKVGWRYLTTILATAWFSNSSATRTATVASPLLLRSTDQR